MRTVCTMVLFAISFQGYTQSKIIKKKHKEPAEALFSEPITKYNLSKYEYLASSKYAEIGMYGDGLINGKKNVAVLKYIEKRANDSVKGYYQREDY